MKQVNQIAIVGTGLLGTSIGLGLKASGFDGRIVGVGRRRSTVERARALGGVDQVTTDLGEALPGSQLAIVGVPLSEFGAVFERIAAHDHDRLILTDVGSTKLSVLAEARRRLPQPERFVGSHPMAGSEKQGPDAAQAELFRGKPCILTPEPDTEPEALRMVQSLWTTLGMSIIRMSAEEHDAQTALVSHLPHAVAVLLVRIATELGRWDIASTGFRDTTRLASSNPPMRADIMLANRRQLIEALDRFGEQLADLRRILDQENGAALLELLNASKTHRDQWLADRG